MTVSEFTNAFELLQSNDKDTAALGKNLIRNCDYYIESGYKLFIYKKGSRFTLDWFTRKCYQLRAPRYKKFCIDVFINDFKKWNDKKTILQCS